MDYPKSTPGVGLVNGKFADENPTTGQIGSLIPAAWGNSVTDELLALIAGGGLIPNEADRGQVLKAVAALDTGVIAAIRGGVIGDLDQLRKVAIAINNDPKFAVTVSEAMAKLVSKTDVYTKAEVDQKDTDAIATIRGGVPTTLNQLSKLAAALNNNPTYYQDVALSIQAKATKATTLAGYGITDAFPITNPLPGGSYDLHAGPYGFVSAQLQAAICQNTSWNGTAWTKHVAANEAATLSVIAGRAMVAKWAAGETGNSPTSNYEVVDRGMMATAAELDAGTETTKWVNVAGVTRMLGRFVKAAAEAVAGVAAIATQATVNAGADDTQIVTPRKLRLGIAYSFTQNGYMAFPQWMGGFIVQWGYFYESQSETDFRAFPVAFPNACLGMTMTIEAATTGGFGSNSGYVAKVVDKTKFLWSVGGTLSGSGYGFAWAWGN